MLHSRLLLIGSVFVACGSADEFLTFLTQDHDGYKVHYSENGNAWLTYAVPSEIRNIEDVEFNYRTRQFYFSSSTPLKKGLWKTNITMGNQLLTQQLRDDSSPIRMNAFPEYDVMFFYDSGYSLVIAITLANEVNDLRIKSLFAESERLNGNYFLDTRNFRILAEQANDTRGFMLTYTMNGTFGANIPFGARVNDRGTGVSYDSSTGILYYCLDDYLTAMNMNNPSATFPTNIRLACTHLQARNGKVYYADTRSQFVQEVSFSSTGVQIINATYMRLPFTISQALVVRSFKFYSWSGSTVNRCENVECSQICLPAGSDNSAKCQCMDYYSEAKNGTLSAASASDPCIKDSLHGPGVYYAVYNVSFARDATLFYRLSGDPAFWTRRPQREQLFTISSDVAAISYSWQSQRIYAAALRYRQIMSASTDGSFNTEGHYSGISTNIKTMAYDWVGNNLMWVDPNFRWIRILAMSPLARTSIFKTIRLPTNLAGYGLRVDAVAGFMFFLEYDDDTMQISLIRCLMDGSEPKEIYNFPVDVYSSTLSDTNPEIPLPGALAVEFKNKEIWVAFTRQMFVVDYEGKLIYRTTIGTPEFTIYNSRVSSVALFSTTYALVVVTRTDTISSTLFAYPIARFANGSCCSSLTNSFSKQLFSEFRALLNYEEQPTPPVSMNCTVLRCSHICLVIKGTPTCVCGDGFQWNQATRDCIRDDPDPGETPTVVFATLDKVCHRTLTDQVGVGGRGMLGNTDNCTSIGFVGGPLESASAMAADPISFRAYMLKLQSNPRQVFSVNLTAAQRGAYSYNFFSALGQLLGGNLTASSYEVFYSAVVTSTQGAADIAFDWLGRNLYIADSASGRLLVVRDDFSSPLILIQNQNFTAIAVDPLRRKLYVSIGSPSGSSIIQKDLDGVSGDCPIATTSDTVIQINVALANQTLLFLSQPSNRLGRINLKQLPPFVSCPSTPPMVNFNQLAKPNVTRIAVYQSVLLFICGSNSTGGDPNGCAQRIFSSASGGLTIDAETSVFQPGRGTFLSSLTVFDPSLLIYSNTSFAANDSCVQSNRGRCEQFCLSSHMTGISVAKPPCQCPDGQRLLSDGFACSTRPQDFSKGVIFTADDYRREVYSVPLTAMDSTSVSIKDILSAYKLHRRTRPYAVAYDPDKDHVYFSDFETGSIMRLKPSQQMSRSAGQNISLETFLAFPRGSRVYGLYIDRVSRTLFFSIRDMKALYAADLETNMTALVKNFSDIGGNVFGVTVDRRPEKMHLYVALRNNSQVLEVVNTTTSTGRTVLQIRSNPSTWSSIVRCSIDGSDCTTIVTYNATTPQTVATVPWIYDMAIDYRSNQLYFTTGQNRSIFYFHLDRWQDIKTLSVMPDNSSFLYGMSFYGDYVLTTDWGRGGIHMHDRNTGARTVTIGLQFMIGLNGLAVYSKLEDDRIPYSQACAGARMCSHVCVPLAGGQARKCLCPGGQETIDGVNCPGAQTCPRLNPTRAFMDSSCNYRVNSFCTVTCSKDMDVDESARGNTYPSIGCINNNGSIEWCASIDDLCPRPNALRNANPTKLCPTLPVADAITSESGASSGGLSGGAIAGIIIAVLVIVAAGLAGGFFAWKRFRNPEIGHERFDVPPGAGGSQGLPHHDELGMPDSFRYRNLAENEGHVAP